MASSLQVEVESRRMQWSQTLNKQYQCIFIIFKRVSAGLILLYLYLEWFLRFLSDSFCEHLLNIFGVSRLLPSKRSTNWKRCLLVFILIKMSQKYYISSSSIYTESWTLWSRLVSNILLVLVGFHCYDQFQKLLVIFSKTMSYPLFMR